jgi:hypothetical protein
MSDAKHSQDDPAAQRTDVPKPGPTRDRPTSGHSDADTQVQRNKEDESPS